MIINPIAANAAVGYFCFCVKNKKIIPIFYVSLLKCL